MEKVKTGIVGFDNLTGGIPLGTRTILYGHSDTGKTVFGMQFLWTGLQNWIPLQITENGIELKS